MGWPDVILNLADRVPIWKRLRKLPQEVDDLQERVTELEAKLSGKWPPDVCKFCGERASRLARTGKGSRGQVVQTWKCSACGQEEIRIPGDQS